MKPFNRNFLTISSKIFEKQTMLSQSVISSDIIVLDSVTKSLLQQPRVKYQRQIIKFENSKTNAKFLTSKKSSFEALIIDNKIALHLPKLTPGIKQPDEFYLDTKKRNAFIIEKKTQSTSGSVDEKLQTAVFKRYVLSKKFKKGWTMYYIFCLSNWFKNGYNTELDYLYLSGIPVFWGENSNYHSNVLKFIEEKSK